MSDPNNTARKYPFGVTIAASHQKPKAPIKAKPVKTLGIELPFDWCLVRGEVLRGLQAQCRKTEFDAALRSRVIGKLLAKAFEKKGVKRNE